MAVVARVLSCFSIDAVLRWREGSSSADRRQQSRERTKGRGIGALVALRELAERAGGLEGIARLSRLLARVLDADIGPESGWSSPGADRFG